VFEVAIDRARFGRLAVRRGEKQMTFEYTGRHVEVTPAIRRHVEEQFRKLDNIFNGTEPRVHVILEVEKNRQIGEIVVHWRDHTLTAKDTNADMYMALTRAVDKIEKQAVKLKKRIIDRKQHARKTSVDAPNPDGQLEATPLPVRIIPARRYAVKPMTAEEAALNLSGRTDHFVVFRDADTNRLGVLYKRQDGNFGLIEP
jgi:putative sigma-54 modulation protein